jgi:hypothetical protein
LVYAIDAVFLWSFGVFFGCFGFSCVRLGTFESYRTLVLDIFCVCFVSCLFDNLFRFRSRDFSGVQFEERTCDLNFGFCLVLSESCGQACKIHQCNDYAEDQVIFSQFGNIYVRCPLSCLIVHDEGCPFCSRVDQMYGRLY